jgi:hypothetical protein
MSCCGQALCPLLKTGAPVCRYVGTPIVLVYKTVVNQSTLDSTNQVILASYLLPVRVTSTFLFRVWLSWLMTTICCQVPSCRRPFLMGTTMDGPIMAA